MALLLAMLAKMSMLFLVGVAPLVLVLRYATLPGRKLRVAALALLLLLLIPYLGVVTAYQFDTRRLPDIEVAALRADPLVPRPVIWAAHVFRVIPAPTRMWKGIVSLVQSNAGGTLIYLLGQIHPNGHPLYFVISLALKVPIPIQLLMLAGAVMIGVRWRRKQLEVADAFWLVPGVLYIFLASLSSLQLGVRLVLPALPFGVLCCGLPVAAWMGDRRLAMVSGLFTWLALKSLTVYPHGISFFNLWVGGPEHGSYYLADSNIDWGQDLAELSAFVQSRAIPKIYLSYFGTDNPYRYFREEQIEILVPPWGQEWAKGAVYKPTRGFYAISANLIPGHMFGPQYRDYYQAFQGMEPVAKAGYSIHIYYVP